ncbi:GntR family transcriptional regulator [Actinoallomurus sp. CA-150999]|uniref:GntR family transcriptional regulator n=1 Tax=Actinoallomurus sp. CA-150999 TaxID=3239887 RepID=UPI003D8BEFC8
MPQRTLRLPGIERLDLPQTRQSIVPLHAYLRECILDGRIPPETKLSQAALAEQLGVSRTPLREVLRMLQEEGLIESEPNQRMRVAGFNPAELDVTYGSRIVLECLAVAMTIGGFKAQQRRQAKAALTAMRRAARSRDVAAWFIAHGEYHHLLSAAADEPLRTQLRSLADRSARYIRIAQHVDPTDWQKAGDVEHPAILEAMVAGDERAAVSLTARHLEHTAVRVLTDCASDYVLQAVPKAVALMDTAPAALARASGNGHTVAGTDGDN